MQDEQQPPALPTGPQKRILATSVRGDSVWEISYPVLMWMMENGDSKLASKASAAIAWWESEQGWFIQWGNDTKYFQLAELACHDLAKFKEMIKIAPADNPGMQHIIDLALMVGELFNKPSGISRKKFVRRQSKGRRRR